MNDETTTDTLAEEIAAGQGLSLVEAGQRLPVTRGGKKPTLGCVLRWVLNGTAGPNGERVYLEAARLSGRWITTGPALARFIERQTPKAARGDIPASRSPAKRQSAAARADKELDRIGI